VESSRFFRYQWAIWTMAAVECADRRRARLHRCLARPADSRAANAIGSRRARSRGLASAGFARVLGRITSFGSRSPQCRSGAELARACGPAPLGAPKPLRKTVRPTPRGSVAGAPGNGLGSQARARGPAASLSSTGRRCAAKIRSQHSNARMFPRKCFRARRGFRLIWIPFESNCAAPFFETVQNFDTRGSLLIALLCAHVDAP
jgi:hypothetical protein